MKATLTQIGQDFMVTDEDGDKWDVVYNSGGLCLCELETNEKFWCGAFFPDSRVSIEPPGRSGDLRVMSDADEHEIDGFVFEATDSGGWLEVEPQEN